MIDYREDNRWTVYVHIVPKEISGYEWDKYYVGITGIGVKARWGFNGNGYKTQYFYRAIQKYEWSNLEHEIIASNLTKEEAKKIEIFLIKELNSNNKLHGYNLSSGGDGGAGIRKYGENNHFYNKNHTEEAKKKMSENHYDCRGKNNPFARSVINITDGIVYATIRFAAKKTNFKSDGHISDVCNGKRNYAGKNKNGQKIRWKYYDDYLKEHNLTDEEARKSLIFIDD